MSRTVLVTGANGFLGSHVVQRLSADEQTTVLATLRNSRDNVVAKPSKNLRYVVCELADSNAVASLFGESRIDAVVHTAAALTPLESEAFAPIVVQSNIASQANLVSEALRCECRHFVYCSSISVYDGVEVVSGQWNESECLKPSSLYGWSKLAGEEILRILSADGLDLNAVSLRLSGIHGPGRTRGAVYFMLDAALSGKPLIVNEPLSRFRLLFVDDAVGAILTALEHPVSGGYACYNIAGEETFTLMDLAQRIIGIANSRSLIQTMEQDTIRNRVMSIHLMNECLGYRPQSLDFNLERFMRYIQEVRL